LITRPGRCWYCGLSTLADDDPPEHVVPAALGGGLTTDRVCRECNTRAGREIDKPLLGDWTVGWERVIWDIRDVRHGKSKPTPFPDEELTLPSGTSVRWRHDMTLEVIPNVDRGGDNVSLVAGSDAEALEMMNRIAERARRDGKTLTAGEMRREFSNEVGGRFVLDQLLWLRASTKMAVAAASLVLPESWLDTQQAEKYREFLWDENPTTFDGQHPARALPQESPVARHQLVDPPEHLVMMVPSRGHIGIVTLLFGSLSAGTVQFEIEGIPPQNAWVLDPRARTVTETTFQALTDQVAMRLIEAYRGGDDEVDDAAEVD
jgi:hypothetical protein